MNAMKYYCEEMAIVSTNSEKILQNKIERHLIASHFSHACSNVTFKLNIVQNQVMKCNSIEVVVIWKSRFFKDQAHPKQKAHFTPNTIKYSCCVSMCMTHCDNEMHEH